MPRLIPNPIAGIRAFNDIYAHLQAFLEISNAFRRLEELENQEELEAPLSSSSFAIAKGLDKACSGFLAFKSGIHQKSSGL